MPAIGLPSGPIIFFMVIKEIILGTQNAEKNYANKYKKYSMKAIKYSERQKLLRFYVVVI